MLLFSSAIYFLTAFLFCLFLYKEFSITRFVILFFLITFSVNVLVFEILHFFNAVNNITFFLPLQLLFCGLLIFISLRKPNVRNYICRTSILTSVKTLGVMDYFLLSSILVILATTLVVGISWPINNSDSLHTHLPRILYWLQQGNLRNWTNNPESILATTYPINAHLQGLWLFLLGKSESFFFLVQWFGLLVVGVSVYGITRNIGGSTIHALFACLIVTSLPVVILQTFSFQGDLLVAALLGCGVFFLTEYSSKRTLLSVYMSSIPLALSIGTKYTAFFVVPFLILWLVVLLVKQKVLVNVVIKAAVFFFLAFTFLGIFKYVYNFISYKSFTGSVAVSNSDFSEASNITMKFKTNTFRLLYQFFGSEGLIGKPMDVWESSRKSVFQYLDAQLELGLLEDKYLPIDHDASESFSFLPSTVSEDTSWFGPFAPIIWLLGVPLSLRQKSKNIKSYAITFMLITVLYYVILVFQRPGWDPYQGRYFITSFVITSPLLGFILPTKKLSKICVVMFVAICSISLFASTIVFNVSRPLITKATTSNITNDFFPILENGNKLQNFEKDVIGKIIMLIEPNLLDRKDMFTSTYYERLFFQNASLIQDAEMIDQIAKTNDIYFWKTGRTPLEYSLFGKDVTRRVYIIDSIADVDNHAYIIIANKDAYLLGDSVSLVKAGKVFSIYNN